MMNIINLTQHQATFPFLIGKVLTIPKDASKIRASLAFPFLIGKVLTSNRIRQTEALAIVSIPYR